MKYYKLHLIRHGLTAGNLQGLYIGSGSDLPLCDEGRAQLKTLKKDFDYPVVPLGARGRGGPADVLQPHVVDADEDV